MGDIGRVMFGVGALIVHPSHDKLLVLKRSSSHSDFNLEKWEILYGRKSQHEDIEAALRRECKEELGIDQIEIGPALRLWHFYRGSETDENEIIGLTFVCSIGEQVPSLSPEHSDYRWVTPDEALNLITVHGIRQDVDLYARKQWAKTLATSPLSGELRLYDQAAITRL